MFDPEIGFTSDVIRDPQRFVGRSRLIRNCIKGVNAPTGLIAVYGKRGVGKSSLLRQVQQMATGDYTLAIQSGVYQEVPQSPRKYLTVYYACDSFIADGPDLLRRLCNDDDPEDGLLRLIPNKGKELTEFKRIETTETGTDLKVIKWGDEVQTEQTFSRTTATDVVQTFRNYINSILQHQLDKLDRDGLLILLDEFDVIRDKTGLGSLIKSLSSHKVKFGICGIGTDLIDLVQDHKSVTRLLEQGHAHVATMTVEETIEIINRAEKLFSNQIEFTHDIKQEIARISEGYPYLTQLLGKACISKLNITGTKLVDKDIFSMVLDDIKDGTAFPTLESAYQRAIGRSEDRQILLHLLAEQSEDTLLINEKVGRVFLRKARKEAEDFDIQYVDQLIPRLVDENYGPVLTRLAEQQGVYEFTDPILRIYVTLRSM